MRLEYVLAYEVCGIHADVLKHAFLNYFRRAEREVCVQRFDEDSCRLIGARVEEPNLFHKVDVLPLSIRTPIRMVSYDSSYCQHLSLPLFS